MEREAAIICVDDESMILNSLRTELRDAFGDRYMIEVAESGEDALDILEELTEEQFEIPVIISDYIMPEMRGDTLLEAVHQRMPTTRTIMLTGQTGLEGVTNAVNKANLYRYLNKPWSPDDLKITVEKALLSYYQDQQLEKTNQQLILLNASLEEKVKQRTKELSQSNQNLALASKELSLKNKIIEQKNKNIEASINYAKRLQEATLPSQHILQNTLPNSFIFFRPRDIVSGDFYWTEQVDDLAIIIVADCTGHGIPGAFLSTIGVVLLNKIVLDEREFTPSNILQKMDEYVQQTFRHSATDIADGMDMAVCTYHLKTHKLSFAGAKSPLVLIQQGEMKLIKGDMNPIGGKIKLAMPYSNHEFELQPQDQFFIYSDGFQDQFGGEIGKKIMAGNFRNQLHSIANLPPKEQLNVLEDTLQTWMGTTYKQIDDILVVGVSV